MLLSSLSKFTVAVANLAEAEVKALRDGMLTLCLRACLVFAGVLLLLGGLAFLLFGLYAVVREAYSAGTAGLVTGAGTMAVAVVWIALVMSHDRKSRR
jgi:hypothetical protein